MQLSQIALLIAAAGAASATQVFAGERYADHKCEEPHSLPNRDYHVGECIELETVKSLNLEYYAICILYEYVSKSPRSLSVPPLLRNLVADFQDFKGPGKVASYDGYGACYDTSKGYWPKAKSYMCVGEYPQH
ncbi:hypothetical protein NLG97_g4927 [Lecanicillium saksenae]|uniref:Uncharacterized protein n=1 Tax=Lecanicillium saksenae TaxID=468837 RepID=A0ACC1QUG5_9HYPO|nr:hypothetical protein NLG97_g4927 [Lecanicillium saksenae]